MPPPRPATEARSDSLEPGRPSAFSQYAPSSAGRCGPKAAAQLQPIPYACGTQHALLPIAVGSMNVNELMNINNVCESATIFPRPCKWTFNLMTLKVVSIWYGIV